jgi:transaldolase
MSESPLKALHRLGQSPWLDYIQRDLLRSGELTAMIERWGIRGVTSNPAIFEKAITETADYDEQIGELAQRGLDAAQIFEAIALADIRQAADILRPVYDASEGRDGYVSLEVSPHLAYDTQASIAEARRLWGNLDRPNAMIKIPGTPQGLPAIRQLLAERMNVNVTLLFALDRYRQVAEIYLDALEHAAGPGRSVSHIASVASFFLSRIDSAVDPRLATIVEGRSPNAGEAARLLGRAAVASARCAYAIFTEVFESNRFRHLAEFGAQPQRLLWASTGTKNPVYSDVKYVEPLIGPATVNTMPLATLSAYFDHGKPAVRIADNPEAAAQILRDLNTVGIDIGRVTEQLETQGVQKFIAAYDACIRAIAIKCGARHAGGLISASDEDA